MDNNNIIKDGLTIDYVSLLINIYCDYLNSTKELSNNDLQQQERSCELELLEIKLNKLNDLSLKYELNSIELSLLCCLESIQILDQFILKYQIRNENRNNVEYLITKRNNICKRAKYLKKRKEIM